MNSAPEEIRGKTITPLIDSKELSASRFFHSAISYLFWHGEGVAKNLRLHFE